MDEIKNKAINYAKEAKGKTYFNMHWEEVERYSKRDLAEAFMAGAKFVSIAEQIATNTQKAFNLFNAGYTNGVKQVAWENTYGGFWQIPAYTARHMNLPPPTPPHVEFLDYIDNPEIKLYYDERWARTIQYYCIRESKLIRDRLSVFGKRYDDYR